MALTQVTPDVLHNIQGNITQVGTLGNLTVSGNISVTGGITQNSVLGGIIPQGGIIMWSGSIASIPAGWALCNGSNGTPDLRNRFIVGAGSTYSVAGTGGSADAIVVSHSHTASSSFSGNPLAGHSHTATVTDPGHNHTATVGRVNGAGDQSNRFGSFTDAQSRGTATTDSSTTGISVAIDSVSAGTPSGSVSTTVNAQGSSGTNANLPPYYALAFIMKL